MTRIFSVKMHGFWMNCLILHKLVKKMLGFKFHLKSCFKIHIRSYFCLVLIKFVKKSISKKFNHFINKNFMVHMNPALCVFTLCGQFFINTKNSPICLIYITPHFAFSHFAVHIFLPPKCGVYVYIWLCKSSTLL